MLRTEQLDAISDRRLRSKRSNDAEDLALGAMFGERQELEMVFLGEMRG